MWNDVYSVSDVLDDDFMALSSGIAYVQKREPSIMFVGVGSLILKITLYLCLIDEIKFIIIITIIYFY